MKNDDLTHLVLGSLLIKVVIVGIAETSRKVNIIALTSSSNQHLVIIKNRATTIISN